MFGGFGQNQPPQTSGGGFSFGSTTGAAPPTAATTGFSFGTAGQIPTPATSGSTSFTGFGPPNPSTGAAPTTTVAATSGTTGFNFGSLGSKAAPSATGGFNFGLNAQQAPITQQAPSGTGFSFGAAPQPAATTTTAPPPASFGSSGSMFGMKVPVAGATAAATTTAPAPGLGGFSGFGTPPTAYTTTGSVLGGLLAKPATTTVAPSVAATTSAPSGFSLGSLSAASTSSTGFSLGVATSTAQTSVAAPSLGGGFGSLTSTATITATTTAAAATAPSLSTATLGSGVAGQKQMTFRQLEDTINKWTTELEDQERYFLDQATQVNAWDRIVMENGEKIIQLNNDVERVKLDQQKLDHELDFVLSQQKELEELVEPLEKILDNLPPISHQQHAHLEREHTYMLAESLDTQLKRMGQDLKEIVERLNSNTSRPDCNDPVQQITKILNAHVDSLMWVDRNSANLQRRVEGISKLMETEKREQERNFRLAYS